nr:MAG TPA: hypothetical protein [Caudoviricetes sp.]
MLYKHYNVCIDEHLFYSFLKNLVTVRSMRLNILLQHIET